MQDEIYDVVVLGSGLVGSSFLLAMANASLNMAVIDKQMTVTCPGHVLNARAIALSHASLESLKKLNIESLIKDKKTSIQEVHVSSQGKFGITRILASQHHLTALGAVIDADILNHALNQALETLSNLTILRGEQIQFCHKHEKGWRLGLASGKTLLTRLLVGADGTESFVRRRFGVEVYSQDYQQQAIVCNVLLEMTHNNTAYERFLSEGSIAFLPFGENVSKCIWIGSNDNAKRFMAQSEADYLDMLQNKFGFRMRRFKALGQRQTYSLKQVASSSLYGPGWVLLGNAANTLHPLAAQGFNLGLRDAMCLANILIVCDKQKNTLTDISLLQTYARHRQADHFYTNLLTQTLACAPALHTAGILAAELFPRFKARIAQQGLGTFALNLGSRSI